MTNTTHSNLLKTAALTTALALFGLSAQASTPSICKTTPQDAFFEIFKCGKVVEIAWTEDYNALRGFSSAEPHAYIKGIVAGLHSPSAPFHVAPQLLMARDPKLPFRLDMKTFSNPDILNDTFQDGLNILSKTFGVWADERRRQISAGVIDPMGELGAAFGKGMSAVEDASILWAGRYGEHDFHTLAALSHTDPDTAVAIYQALAELAERM